MAGWTVNLNEWAESVKTEMLDTKRFFALASFTKIVLRTPVDKGGHRQNWLVTLNGESFAYNPDAKKGGHVLNAGRQIILGSKPGDRIVFQNNGPAIEKLEYGGYGPNSKSGKTINGFSRQAPNGMVGITMMEASGILNQTIQG